MPIPDPTPPAAGAPPAQAPTIGDLREHGPLAQVPEALLARVAPRLTVVRCADGEVLFREGDRDARVFLLHRGRVRISVQVRGREVPLREIEAPTALGELSWLDGAPRSATATAVGPVTLFSVDPNEATEDTESTLFVVRSLAQLATERLRAASQREAAERDTRERFGKLNILVMLVLSLFAGLAGLSGSGQALGGLPVYLVAPALMISMVWLAVAAVRVTARPAATFGLTFAGTGRALGEGAVVSAAMVGLYELLGVGMSIPEILDTLSHWPRWFVYVVVAVLQELFCRGILLTGFLTFYDDRRGLKSVLLVALVYGVGHVYLGVGATVGSFLLGIPLGFLYLRHRNLFGVVLVHYVAGALAVGAGLLAR